MGRLTSFITGAFVGATIMLLATKFHFVRAEDGFHMVPRVTSSMTDTYVDIREFTVSDWNEHRLLLAALVRAEKSHVVQDKTLDNIGEKFGSAIESLRHIAG
ncbi:MAG: hypothetical protein MI757_12475 [Pirellulales bacterium]|nr:hypothetical protein [Pirellulales bacterium]